MISQTNSYMSAFRFIATLNRFNIPVPENFYDNHISFTKSYAASHLVVIVGSNPSTASEGLTPFHESTKSRKTIDSWFKDEDEVYFLAYRNITNVKTNNNKSLTNAQIIEELPDIQATYNSFYNSSFKIIACGETAHKALSMVDIEHFTIPHPSGCCRFWNDKNASKVKINEMLKYIKQK